MDTRRSLDLVAVCRLYASNGTTQNDATVVPFHCSAASYQPGRWAGGFSAFLRTFILRIRYLPVSLLPLYPSCFFPYGLVKEDVREKGLSR